MNDTQLIVFDDKQGRWGPLVDLRPVFHLRSGCWDALKRIEHVNGQSAAAIIVPENLHALSQSTADGYLINQLPETGEDFLIVNGRWLGLRHQDEILNMTPQSVLMQNDQQLVAARVDRETAGNMVNALSTECNQNWVFFELKTDELEMKYVENDMLAKRPWEVLADLKQTLTYDIGAVDLPLFEGKEGGVTVLGDYPVKVAVGVEFEAMVVLDARRGPIAVDAGVRLGSFSVLEGPCYIGKETIVKPQTHLIGPVAFGEHCVVGGEIESTIIQAYSNKSHGGYLGHSILGQWVNLGAGTNVSNLKNTYGDIRMRLNNNTLPENTECKKMGAMLGDFVKTAIGTRLNTGTCLGTGTMIAVDGLAPKLTECFSFVTKAGDEAYEIDKFLHTSKAVMHRRGCSLDVHQIKLLNDLFETMQEERHYRIALD